MSVKVKVLMKAPVAGVAKTRLIPALGAEGAARLAERMAREVIARVARVPAGLRLPPGCERVGEAGGAGEGALRLRVAGPVAEAVRAVLEQAEVLDLEIREPPIEEVIAALWRGERAG